MISLTSPRVLIGAASAIGTALFTLMDANPTLYIYDATISRFQQRRKLQGKRVWITGASSGIGEKLAEELYCKGAKVIASARSVDKLRALKDTCRGIECTSGGSIDILPFDVTSSQKTIENAVDKAINIYGGIDILILNAGRSQRLLALDTNEDATRNLMELNYFGPVRIALATIKRDRWKEKLAGHIVVTSSVAGKYAVPLSSSYAASKHAINGYFTSLRSENRWLRIDLVCPGPVGTSIERSAVSEENQMRKDSAGSKMKVKRCAKLMISSMVGPSFLFYESWLAKQPVLLFSYLNQYTPDLSSALISFLGSIRIKAFTQGLDMYKASDLLKAAFSSEFERGEK